MNLKSDEAFAALLVFHCNAAVVSSDQLRVQAKMEDDLELLGSGVDPIAEQFDTYVATLEQMPFLRLVPSHEDPVSADTRSTWTSKSLLQTYFTLKTCH